MSFPKSRIITVYFGALPEWLPLWLKSCQNNPEFEWLLFVDQLPNDSNIPDNVKFESLTLEAFRSLAEQKLGLEPCIPKPYKLCDFKVAYGLIFEDYLKDYDFWGYGDLDVIWGRLSTFLPPEVFNSHDQILLRGHLTFFRNEKEIVTAFKLPSSAPAYHKVFTEPQNFLYDEWTGIFLTFKENDLSQFHKEFAADIDYEKRRFELTKNNNYDDQAFVWRDGSIWQIYWNDSLGRVQCKEFAYIHFQKRKMPVRLKGEIPNEIAITPRGFCVVRHPLKSANSINGYNKPPLMTRRELDQKISDFRVRFGRFRRNIFRSKT